MSARRARSNAASPTVSLTTGGWDRGLWLAAGGLALLGGMAMASAAATLRWNLAVRHWIWIGIGVALSLLAARTSVRRWTGGIGVAYVVGLVLLAVLPVAGAMRLGATRWLSLFGLSFQPSELAKLTTAWMLARYLAGQPSPLPARVFWTSCLWVLPPALLVFLQPDLGSASVFGAIWLGQVWVAGARRRLLGGLAAGGLALAPVAWFWLLKDYQRDRLAVFLNPHADPLGAGYTIIQSTIAIGSGRLWGRGWFAGTQNQLSFLPERHSDFIFSVIGEEWGLLGCLAVVGLFAWLLTRILHIAAIASDPQQRLLAVGLLSWIGYQAVVNMGMVMGLLPVVGVPLPLISYGGTSMVVLWTALGVLQAVHREEHRR